MTKKEDNVVYLNKKIEVKMVSVPELCHAAGEILEDVLIIGAAHDGSIKMITSKDDVSEILFYLETAKFAIMSDDIDYKDE
jgi:hypothetical protein